MHNWLIFQYHHIMRPCQSGLAKGMPLAIRPADEPTQVAEASNAGTQEGK